MFCPKCAAEAVPGQRFCRNCGTNLGVILDAIENKQRGPIDFETLKSDLRELGSNLRAGFEQASASFKGTKRFDRNPAAQMPANFPPPQVAAAELAQEIHKSIRRDVEHEISKGLRKVRVANTRKYSLQQATLSLFGGGAMLTAWYYILDALARSNIFDSIERVILEHTGSHVELQGLAVVFRLLWLLGLIPVARGAAHLVNGIFFAPKQAELQAEEAPIYQPQPQNYVYSPPWATPVSATPAASHIAGNTTNELNERAGSIAQPSVTEEETMRFGAQGKSQI